MPGNARVAFKSVSTYLFQTFRVYIIQLGAAFESVRPDLFQISGTNVYQQIVAANESPFTYCLYVISIAYITQVPAAEEHVIANVFHHVLVLAAESVELRAISKYRIAER